MFFRLFNVAFFVFIAFFSEILFVQYLPTFSDTGNAIVVSHFSSKADIHDVQFPCDRRKTAPEIRKHAYNFIKKQVSLMKWKASGKDTLSIVGRLFESEYFVQDPSILQEDDRNFIFDHRFLIKKYALRLQVVPRNVI